MKYEPADVAGLMVLATLCLSLLMIVADLLFG